MKTKLLTVSVAMALAMAATSASAVNFTGYVRSGVGVSKDGATQSWMIPYVGRLGNEADTYRFGRGDGHDTVIDDSWNTGALDRIELKSGITLADIRLQRVNGDLVLTIRETGDTLTVKNQFADARFRIEELALADPANQARMADGIATGLAACMMELRADKGEGAVSGPFRPSVQDQ